MAIIFSDEFSEIVAGDPLVYVDAGARGGLEGPWRTIKDDRLYVVAFEPDPDACAELARTAGQHGTVVSKALWSEAGTLALHLASHGTSSVHPPNFSLLERFPASHGEPRTTLRTETVECTTLDSVLGALGRRADFIKIDTQGAEYEILMGASKALADSVFGVIAETWTIEVHKGQRLTGDILTFMHDRGFELFDLSLAAAWHRRGVDRLIGRGKRQVIGLDLLFFREPTCVRERLANPIASAKAAAIAELYGFPDLALEVLEMCVAPSQKEADIMSHLRQMILEPQRQGEARAQTFPERIRGFLKRRKPTDETVKLHY